MNEEGIITEKERKLRIHIREEFVDTGFIEVHQWRNFVDYLDILIKNEIEKSRKGYIKLNDVFKILYSIRAESIHTFHLNDIDKEKYLLDKIDLEIKEISKLNVKEKK